MNNNEFEITENGILRKYNGKGGAVFVPENVTRIDDEAFSGCSSLTSITIPESVTEIGYRGFSDCSSLKSIMIPESVTEIGYSAFDGCTSLTSITIPDSVTDIGDYAFSECIRLRKFVCSPSLKLNNDIFGGQLPRGLRSCVETFIWNMTDSIFSQYVASDKKIWDALSVDAQARSFLSRQSRTLAADYAIAIADPNPVGEQILSLINKESSVKECLAVSSFMIMFAEKLPEDLINRLYAKLQAMKKAEKALKAISDSILLMEKLNMDGEIDGTLPEVEHKLMQMLKEQKKTRKDLETELKDYYALVPEDLPELQYQNGEKASPIILTYVLTAHEKQEKIPYGNPIVKAKSEVPGICDEAAGIIAGIDSGSLQKALVALADQYLEEYTKGKKVFLPYPICRYADETTMRELTSRAPKWATSVSGINAPALKNFRQACLYSETREAMLFADKMGDLDAYAKIRGTTADMIRDQYLSDVGLAPDGTKSYDLGNQTVTARLQKDLSFAVELAEGKPAKSLPKKGADPDKYEIANADFSEMKKAVKKIVKNRVSVLFDDFLNNHSRAAVEWKAAYLDNPVLRIVASLLVWKQNRSTFIVTDTGIIKADGSEYVINDKNKISIAHPMDMSADDVAAWQKYFTAHGLKQPFMQIWEPVIAPETIMNDRYKGCMIPYYRFVKQEKHGIYVSDENFHNEISISFDDCDAVVERIDWLRHMIEMNHNFEVTLFKFKKYTRKVNHVVAYLDRVTVYGRILKDDVSIASQMDRFTLAQITEFINAAIENNCTNVTALLLDYKNKCFSDFEPMDEFVLE